MRSLNAAQRRHIELHIALLPIYIWTVVAWSAYVNDISAPGRLDRAGHMKGHDFVHFYVVGEIGRDARREELYSFDAQAKRTDRLVPEYPHRFQPVHGPQVAMFFAPLALLSYVNALVLWLIASAVVYSACVYVLWRSLPSARPHGWAVALVALGFPGFYSVIAWGQTSAFALAWLTCAYLAMRAGRPWLAGAALGTLVYKPTLLLLAPFALVVRRDWRMLAGAALAAGAQLAMAMAYFGAGVIVNYVAGLVEAQRKSLLFESRPQYMHSLDSFFKMLVPSSRAAFVCYAISSFVIAGIALRVWRTDARLELRFAVVLLASVLVDPHVYSYELVVLVPALMFAMQEAIESRDRRLAVATYCAYLLPAFPPLATPARLQLSILAMAVLLWMLSRRALSTSCERGADGSTVRQPWEKGRASQAICRSQILPTEIR
jgi:Glycosyltransferase family 87